MVATRAERCKKKVFNPIFQKSTLFAETGRGGGNKRARLLENPLFLSIFTHDSLFGRFSIKIRILESFLRSSSCYREWTPQVICRWKDRAQNFPKTYFLQRKGTKYFVFTKKHQKKVPFWQNTRVFMNKHEKTVFFSEKNLIFFVFFPQNGQTEVETASRGLIFCKKKV